MASAVALLMGTAAILLSRPARKMARASLRSFFAPLRCLATSCAGRRQNSRPIALSLELPRPRLSTGACFHQHHYVWWQLAQEGMEGFTRLESFFVKHLAKDIFPGDLEDLLGKGGIGGHRKRPAYNPMDVQPGTAVKYNQRSPTLHFVMSVHHT